MTRHPADLTEPSTLHAVARAAGLVASRRFSQNFLVDAAVLADIVDALQPSIDDTVLEVGPGVGTLTEALSTRARRVVAVDVDERCVRATRSTMSARENVEVVHGDALRLWPADVGVTGAWIAAGNLPYAITTPLLEHLFSAPVQPARGVFLVQREVAARLAAGAGDWSLATVVVRSLATVERIRDVPPSSFDPQPRVHSSVIRLQPEPSLQGERRGRVIRIAKAAFQARRKMLRHGVTRAAGGSEEAAMAWLEVAGIDATRRPGTLGLEEWGRLADAAATLGASRRP